MIGDSKFRYDLLSRSYQAALNEYHFNVRLAWDRTRFFLALNAGIIAAGIGLLKLSETSSSASFFLIFYFFLALMVVLLGLEIVVIGKRYYRESIYIKTLIERELGLLGDIPGDDRLPKGRNNLSIAVTNGQRDFENILHGDYVLDQPANIISLDSIVASGRRVFYVMAFIDIVGAVIACVNFANLVF